jgi:hypothetical protein
VVDYSSIEDQKEDTDWEEALELCKELLAELADLPERAEDFVASVEEKVLSIMGWIEENEHVTPKQIKALENMLAGTTKWHR